MKALAVAPNGISFLRIDPDAHTASLPRSAGTPVLSHSTRQIGVVARQGANAEFQFNQAIRRQVRT
jgi:hypothetical protein